MPLQKNDHLCSNCTFDKESANSLANRFHLASSALCDPHAAGLRICHIVGNNCHLVSTLDLLTRAMIWSNLHPKSLPSMISILFEEFPSLAWGFVTRCYISKTPINLSHCIHGLELDIAHLWNAIVRAVPGSWIPIGFFCVKLLKTSILFCINYFNMCVEFISICLTVSNAQCWAYV